MILSPLNRMSCLDSYADSVPNHGAWWWNFECIGIYFCRSEVGDKPFCIPLSKQFYEWSSLRNCVLLWRVRSTHVCKFPENNIILRQDFFAPLDNNLRIIIWFSSKVQSRFFSLLIFGHGFEVRLSGRLVITIVTACKISHYLKGSGEK